MYVRFASTLALPLLERASGLRVHHHLRRLRREATLARHALRRVRQERLTTLFRHAYEQVPLYRDLYDRAGIHPDAVHTLEDLSRVPRVTKELLREAYPARAIARDVDRSSLVRKTTSGSTGVPLEMVVERHLQGVQMARTVFGFEWAGAPFGSRCAVIAPCDDRRARSRRLYERVKREHRCHMPSFDRASVARMYDELVRHRPILIMGTPTSFAILAEYVEQVIGVRRSRLRPRILYSVSETLYPADRARLEKTFGARMVASYGSNEIYVTGQECPAGRMHVLASDVVVEVVGDDGTPVEPGEPGRIVITDLWNRAMPFIRYDIGDIGRSLRMPCDCGCAMPVIEIVEGRMLHRLTTPDGKYLFGAHYTRLMRSVDWVRTFQLDQESPERVRLRLDVRRKPTARELRTVVAQCVRLADDSMIFEPEITEHIPVGTNGKRHYFVSRLGADADHLASPV